MTYGAAAGQCGASDVAVRGECEKGRVIALQRLKEQLEGDYDWAELHRIASAPTGASGMPATLQAAPFCGPVEVRFVEGRGRGVVLTADVAAGDLLFVCKALALAKKAD